MKQTDAIQLKVAKGMLLLNFIIGGISFLIMGLGRWIPFITGLVFGTLIALLNFRLLALTIEKAVSMPPHKAQTYATSRYFIRFTLLAIVIIVSLRAEHINALGTIIGLTSIKLVILKIGLFNDTQFFKNIIRRKEAK